MKNVTLISLLALVLAGSASCSRTEKTPETPNQDTAVLEQTDTTAMMMADQATDNYYTEWDSLDYDLPSLQLPNIKGLTGQGDDRLAKFSLGDNVLFGSDQATLSKDGAAGLDEVIKQIDKRFPAGKVKVYGYADTTGYKAYNKELSEKRAEIVRQYLIGEGKINADRISIQAMGEKNPTGINLPNDRRVVIVAKK